jgi:hypothetical protein
MKLHEIAPSDQHLMIALNALEEIADVTSDGDLASLSTKLHEIREIAQKALKKVGH